MTLVEIESKYANENYGIVSSIEIEDENATYGPLNINDPTVWDIFESKFWDFMIEKGPIRENIRDDDYPRDDISRHLANSYYTQLMDSGEKENRE